MTRPLPTSFSVKSFGCQMNVYDGQRMAEMLTAQGMVAADPAAPAADADLVVLNTCHIRERAAEKVYSDIGRLTREDGTRPMIAVAGCVAQAEGAEIPARARTVDIVVGPQAYHRLPAMIAQAAGGQRALDTDMPRLDKFAALPARRRVGASAILTVQEGCDKFCTYCVVPYTRGAEISRSMAALIDEAHGLVDAGAREIVLLGQNVNAWSGTDPTGRVAGLGDLIRAIDRIPGVLRIRYMTSHPQDMADDLIAAHGDVETLMPFLHLPVQSGSDRVLKAMNRRHDVASYLRILDRVRAARPDIALSSDFIVGFPGETEAEFEDTLRLVQTAGYASAFSFKFSARPGTPAADIAGHVPEDVMNVRLQHLQAGIARGQIAFNQRSIGITTTIMIERDGRKPGQRIGKTPWMQSVHVETAAAVGEMVEVEIVSAGPNSLGGVLAAPRMVAA